MCSVIPICLNAWTTVFPWAKPTSASRSLVIICSVVNRLLAILASFLKSRFLTHYLDSLKGARSHLRPAHWIYSVHSDISEFVQFQHLATLKELVEENKDVHTALGDYVVKPDVLVARNPVTDETINKNNSIVEKAGIPNLTPLRQTQHQTPTPILHASISCKLTIRSDRSQNARTEGLNLIRNRKGHTPHIVVVTAEPMPTRIASLALGTGEIDCVYHFGLDELRQVVKVSDNEAVQETLETMVEGDRLRDIADLAFDLVI